MVFKCKKGNANVFVLVIISIMSLGIGSLMYSNFSVFQFSKTYHILRERLLIKKMLFQITEEVILSKYELSTMHRSEDLESILSSEIKDLDKKIGIKFGEFKIIKDQIKQLPKFAYDEEKIITTHDKLNPQLSTYLNQGSCIDWGDALFHYNIHNRLYQIEAKGYGVPLSNFDLVFYDLSSNSNQFDQINQENGFYFERNGLYCWNKDGQKIKVDSQEEYISYKNRKDVSFFCNAYEWLWTSRYLQDLAKNSKNNFILEIPYNGKLHCNGVSLNNDNDTILDLGKIDFDVVTISNSLGGGTIKFKESIVKEQPLIIICHNSFIDGQKTLLEIDQTLKRPCVIYALNSKIKFQNNPKINAAFFCDMHSQAEGRVFLDGHFSYFKGSQYSLDPLDLKFECTPETKIKLANVVPHVFFVDLALLE